jgi:hypothetical protein
VRHSAALTVAGSAPAQKHPAPARRAPAPPVTVAPVSNRSLTTLQRKAQCACGGGCPRCPQANGAASRYEISTPGDHFEQEADRIAKEVVHTPATKSSPPSTVVTQAARSSIQFTSAGGDSAVTHGVLHEAAESPAPGQPLTEGERDFYEPRLGQDLSRVRLHTDAASASSAASIDASAYTIGQDVFFDRGRYSPHTTDGRELLTHELVHTIQQARAASAPARILRSVIPGVSPASVEATPQPAAGVALRDDATAGRGPVPGNQARAGDTAQTGRQNQGGTQTLCFAISDLIPATTPAPRLFGRVAEIIINGDYCRLMGCDPFLLPNSRGTDYFDSILGPAIFIAFLGHHNNLSAWQLTQLAIASLVSLNRPDMLAHKDSRRDFYEIKPNSISGRAAGRLKLRNLASLFAGFSLPYVAGSAYTPTAEIILASGHVGAWPLEIYLRVQRLQNGLIVYDLCARGALWQIGLAVIISILIALIVLIIGGEIEFPIPIPNPIEEPVPTPVPVPVPAAGFR